MINKLNNDILLGKMAIFENHPYGVRKCFSTFKNRDTASDAEGDGAIGCIFKIGKL